MGRAPCCDKSGLKKGPWTPEEDQKLLDYIQKHGHGRWRSLPQNAGLARCGKSCRLRWTNYLRPDIKRGRFSFEEEETIIQLHSVLGNKWSAIAARLPGRTDNEVKNYWNTHIRKRLLRMGIDPVTHSPRLDLLDLSSLLNASLCSSPSQLEVSRLLGIEHLVNTDLLKIATNLLLAQHHNVDIVHQNMLQELQQQQQQQQEHLPNPTIFQDRFQPSLPPHKLPSLAQEIPVCTSSSAPLMQANMRPLQSNDQGILWQNSSLPRSLPDSFSMPQNSELFGGAQAMDAFGLVPAEATDFDPNSGHDFSFPLVPSSPASSPTRLNSSSTHNNSAATSSEDERDSYCNSLLNFQMPDLLDFEGLI